MLRVTTKNPLVLREPIAGRVPKGPDMVLGAVSQNMSARLTFAARFVGFAENSLQAGGVAP